MGFNTVNSSVGLGYRQDTADTDPDTGPGISEIGLFHCFALLYSLIKGYFYKDTEIPTISKIVGRARAGHRG